MYKIASWNVNSLKIRGDQVLDYLEQSEVDVIALQEIKQQDIDVDKEKFLAQGWHIETYGQKTYNGVALLSRKPLTDIIRGIPNYDDPQARVIAGNIDDIRIINVYVPNGKAVDDEKYIYKLDWLAHLHQYIQTTLINHPKFIILGDFNIAPADIDTYDPAKWQDKILCSTPERQALNKLLDLGFKDSFRYQHPQDQQFSWWDYRMGGYRRNLGLRIDLILSSENLTLDSTGIDAEPRTWERPSDHTPVWLKLAEI